MNSILSVQERRAHDFSSRERTQRVIDCTPERLRESLLFLAGFAPAVLDAALDATEPFILPVADADVDEGGDEGDVVAVGAAAEDGRCLAGDPWC